MIPAYFSLTSNFQLLTSHLAQIDALVVGAGPAGSIAALQLARAGVRVALLDRAVFPRPKLCGDTLNPGSLALLDRLGLADGLRGCALRTSGMVVTGPGGASVATDYPDGLSGLAITRDRLDMALLDAAVAAGADFRPSVIVNAPLLADGERRVSGVRGRCGQRTTEFRARIVIAADGRASRLASALRLARFAASPRRWAYGAYFEGVDGVSARGEMHIREGGYLGIAPLPGGLVNVCAVTTPVPGKLPPSNFQRPTAEHRSWEWGFGSWELATAIACDADLRERFRRAQRVSSVTILGPLAVVASAAGCSGLLLAGDAAGFIDPMTGDGLRFAIRGGELAAAAAVRELESGRAAHESLAAARAREFAGKWRINRVLRALVASPRALGGAAVLARHWTAPVEYLVGVAGDIPLARRLQTGSH
jgi:menaquinone-9 beta-reductase